MRTMFAVLAAGSLVCHSTRAQDVDVYSRTAHGLSVGAQHLLYANAVASAADLNLAFAPTGAATLKSAVQHLYSTNPSLQAVRQSVGRHMFTAANVRLTANIGDWTGAAITPDVQTVLSVATVEYTNTRVWKQALYQQREALTALYSDALAGLRSKSSTHDIYAQIISAAAGDDRAKETALKSLHDALPQLREVAEWNTLSDEERELAGAYMKEVLSSASRNPKTLTSGARKSARDGLANATQAIAQMNSSVHGKVREVEEGLRAVNSAALQMEAALSSLAKDPLATANMLLIQRLDPKRQLDAIEKGLNIGGTVEQRRAVLAGLQRSFAASTADVVIKTYDAMSEGVQIATTAVSVARQLNINIPKEVDQALALGNAAMSVASSFATAGPLGGAMALIGGLGGIGGASGSGPDPTTVRMLRQIQETLNQVVEMQKQTLEKLDAIDAKITAHHREVMATLTRIEARVGWLVDQQLAETEVGVSYCAGFENNVRNKAIEAKQNGLPVYDLYVRYHNTEQSYQSNFEKCRSRLEELTKLSNERPHFLLRNWDKSEADGFSENRRSSTHISLYLPAWKLTQDVLDTREHGPCLVKLMELVVKLPASVAAADTSKCAEVVGPSVWTSPSGTTVSVARAMRDYVAHDLQWEGDGTSLFAALLRYQSAIAPFYELTTAPESLQFKTPTQLNGAKYNSTEARDRFTRFLDVTSVAAAQEAIMAGTLIGPQIMKLLRELEGKPGFGFEKAPKEDPAYVEGCQTTGQVGIQFQAITPERLVCVLERNPFMVYNALTLWLAERVSADKLYRYRLYHRNQVVEMMNILVPDLRARPDADGVFGFVLVVDKPHAAKGVATPTPGWYYKMRGAARERVYVPMPSAYDLETRSAKYRPQAESLRQTIAHTLGQVERYSLHHAAGLDAGVISQLAAGEAVLTRAAMTPTK